MPSSFFGPSRFTVDGSRSPTTLRSSTSDVDTDDVASKAPELIARVGLSSSRLDTAAEARISFSPIRCTAATLAVKAGEAGSMPTSASAKATAWPASREAASGLIGTAGPACFGATGATGAGGTRTSCAPGSPAAGGGVGGGRVINPALSGTSSRSDRSSVRISPCSVVRRY